MTFPVLRCAYDAHIRAHIRRRATNRIADLWPSCKRMAIAVLELSCVPSLRKVLPTDRPTTINPAGAGQEGWRVTPTASEYTFYSNVANYKAKCHLVTGRRDDRLLFYFPWPADNPVPALRLGIGSDSSSAARTRLEDIPRNRRNQITKRLAVQSFLARQRTGDNTTNHESPKRGTSWFGRG